MIAKEDEFLIKNVCDWDFHAFSTKTFLLLVTFPRVSLLHIIYVALLLKC